MPTYQYACTSTECANEFELVQSFTDPAASECPVCGGPVRKVYSAVGVVFKGSGFYRTDSRAANGSSKSRTESSSAKSDSSKSDSSKSDSSKSDSSNGSSSGSAKSDSSSAPATSSSSSSSKAASTSA